MVYVTALSVVRFAAVKKRFVFELKELRSREQTQLTNQCVVSLLMGMKFFRVKVVLILLNLTLSLSALTLLIRWQVC